MPTPKTIKKAPTAIIVSGTKYVTAVSRGTEYTLMKQDCAWYVASNRLALGRSHIGGGKHYKTLAEVAARCKAFGGEAEIFKLYYGFDIANAVSA